MRAIVRWGVTIVGTLLLGVVIFSLETILDSAGYTGWLRTLISGSWQIPELDSKWWFLSAFLFFAGASVALWVDYWIRQKTTIQIVKISSIKETITGHVFHNTDVPLDGKKYTECTFRNVTFIYNGGRFELHKNDIDGCFVKSQIKEIDEYAALLFQLGFLNVPVLAKDGPLENKNTFYDEPS